jgi:ABC-type antimicrobial peptide transport system permease subunit
MAKAILKKSWNDLKIRKSRTFFIVLTIALSVSGLSMFAVMPLMDQAMSDEVEKSNMFDVKLSLDNLELSESNFQDLENLDNIKSVEGKYVYYSRMYIGERRNDALFVGVTDFGSQSVDIVDIESGSAPGNMQVLTDSGNKRSNLYDGSNGDTIRAYNSTGEIVELTITGSGHTLSFDQATMGVAVFYTDMATVHSLSEGNGYNYITVDLENADEADAEKAVEDIRQYLTENTEFVTYSSLPQVREDGDWPGKDDFGNLASFFYILTLIAMFCSLFLISNTMHTMITEQRKEIAQMKAIGATRKQVVGSYLTTSLMIGLIGSSVGVVLGIAIAYLIESYFLTSFYGVQAVFAIHTQTILLSVFIGLSITILASLPALFKALKITVRQGMEGVALSQNGSSGIHRGMLKLNSLPRSSQMGIRNITRKKGRSASTIIQVALAVGIFLAIFSIGITINNSISEEFDNFTYDIMTLGQVNDGKPLTEDVGAEIESIDGVSRVEPFVMTGSEYNDRRIQTFGYIHNTVSYNYEDTHDKGRWFEHADHEKGASVIVIGKALADVEDIKVGDSIKLNLATGEHSFEVIGINSGQMNNGMVSYMPFSTLQNKLMWNDTVSGFSIITNGDSHDLIDRVSTQIEDDLLASGYVVNN